LAEKKKVVPKAAARKVKDRWKAKEWYKIHAPMMFNQVQLGETPSADPSSLIGRMTEVTVNDLTGDFSKMHVKLKFRVNDVRGFEAHTIFIGQDLTSDYIRRLTRRKKTKTDHVIDVQTKDGYKVRIKPMSITDQRIQASQETAVRNIMTNETQKLAADMTISDLVKSVISGDLARRLSSVSKVIVPIKRGRDPQDRGPRDGQRRLAATVDHRAARRKASCTGRSCPCRRVRRERGAQGRRRGSRRDRGRGRQGIRREVNINTPGWLSLVERRTHKVLGERPLQGNPKVMGSNPIPGTPSASKTPYFVFSPSRSDP
jgi:small subunit ribosomal protein S3Ae